MDIGLEICVDSVESAVNAQLAGAARVELCDNLTEGGTTPSYGTIVLTRRNIDIGLHVIIRPRGSDFLYSDIEFDTMKRDIEMCGEQGVDGVVFGVLQKEGAIDFERTARLAEFAYPMAITFHRAFDMCNDPVKGLEDVIAAGASRVLTSGRKNRAIDGIDLIRKLVIQAADRIIIMPGAGIDETNVERIVSVTKVREIHLTGRKSVSSEMIFRQQGISMGSMWDLSEFTRKVADIEKIRNIISITGQK